MTKRTRLLDIARETGFSVNTVSLALNGSNRISSKTRDTIKQVADRIHYVPNGLARSLAKNESNTIGVILRNLRSQILVEMVGYIEQYLRENGYSTIITGAKRDAAKSVDSLMFQKVDGILVYPDLSETDFSKFTRLRANDFPLVFMSSDGRLDGLDVVYMDRKVGGYKATAHLAELGHKKIGFLAGDSVKMEGYIEALKKYGLPYDERMVIFCKGFSCEEGYNATRELLGRETGITALFCSTDIFAIGASKFCAEAGVRIPDDLAIVGYDNIEVSNFLSVPLTTISYNIQEETQKAVELLLNLMRDKPSQVEPVSIALNPELIIRESCGTKLKQRREKLNETN